MHRIAVILFLVSVFVYGFMPTKDSDFGWHYRCGKELITSGNLCINNYFSYYLADYKSANPSFLYDIVLATIYDKFGFIGLSLANSIIFTLCAFIIYKLFPVTPLLKIASFYIIFLLSGAAFNLGLRSQAVTYLFFLISLLIIHQYLNKTISIKKLLFLPSLILIWVNTHIGFFLGLILTGILFIDQLITSLIIKSRETIIKNIKLSIFLVLSFIATLISPFGIRTYLEVLNHATMPMNRLIAEWLEPPLWQNILIILLTVFIIIITFRKKSFSVFNLILILLFSVLAFKARRNLPFFWTAFFYVLFNNYYANKFLSKLNFFNNYPEILSSISISLIIFFSITGVGETLRFSFSWDNYCHKKGLVVYPCEAIKNYSNLSGNVFTMYEWGGFLIWQKPDIKVFADGRMPAWKDPDGQSPYQVLVNIMYASEGWNKKLESLKTDYIFIANNQPLDNTLKDNPSFGWQEVYRNYEAVIYKKIK